MYLPILFCPIVPRPLAKHDRRREKRGETSKTSGAGRPSCWGLWRERCRPLPPKSTRLENRKRKHEQAVWWCIVKLKAWISSQPSYKCSKTVYIELAWELLPSHAGHARFHFSLLLLPPCLLLQSQVAVRLQVVLASYSCRCPRSQVYRQSWIPMRVTFADTICEI